DSQHVEALGNEHDVNVNVSAGQTIMNRDCIGILFKQVFPSFQRTLAMKAMPEDEDICIANHTGLPELFCDSPGRVTGMQKHKHLLLRRSERRLQHTGDPAGVGEDSNENECEELDH